jgi:glycosyltransferase involved in cell wall biosynthesis
MISIITTNYNRTLTLPLAIGSVLYQDCQDWELILVDDGSTDNAVLASHVGGLPEMVVDGETGYVVKPRDEKALEDRLVESLQRSDLRKAMGARGNEVARVPYHSNVVAAQTVDAYNLALRQGGGQA